MFRRLHQGLILAAGRFCVVCATLVGLVAGAIGFADPPDISFGGSFPCEGNGCGCRTAEDCWFGCCCHTLSQRLVWAEQNGVKPPKALLRIADAVKEKEPGVAVCCSQSSKKRTTDVEQIPGSCCSNSTGSCCAPRKVATTSADDQGDSPLIKTNGCGGRGNYWVTGDQPLSLGIHSGRFSVPTLTFNVVTRFSDYARDPAAPPTRPG